MSNTGNCSALLRRLDKGVNDITTSLELEEIMDRNDFDSAGVEPFWDRANEDFYTVLMDKTEDDALRRIKISEPGNGKEACQRLYRWYSGVSGMGIMERRRQCKTPLHPNGRSIPPSR